MDSLTTRVKCTADELSAKIAWLRNNVGSENFKARIVAEGGCTYLEVEFSNENDCLIFKLSQ